MLICPAEFFPFVDVNGLRVFSCKDQKHLVQDSCENSSRYPARLNYVGMMQNGPQGQVAKALLTKGHV